jgi:hypothetical protein
MWRSGPGEVSGVRTEVIIHDRNRGPASVGDIKQPEVEHRVRINNFENWLDSAGRSPAEMALKSRLRDIIDAKARSMCVRVIGRPLRYTVRC